MTRSELILPLRIYDDFNNQFRFNRDCEQVCQNPLNYFNRELPFFQFRRNASMAPITELIMRNVCIDKENNYYNAWGENASNMDPDALGNVIGPLPQKEFTIEEGGLPVAEYVDIFYYDCGKIKTYYFDPLIYNKTGQDPEITFPALACYSRFKITIDKFYRQNNFQIIVYDGVFVLGTITAPGAYDFSFLPQGAGVIVAFVDMDAGDIVEISHVQLQAIDLHCYINADSRDVIMDYTKIKTVLMSDGSQICVYCEDAQNYQVDPGEYYYIVKCYDSRQETFEFYFSEVFKVKSVKEIQNYYRLKWWHNCDIESNVIYSESILDCAYFNHVFLDSVLFKPEYITTKEIEQDGAGNQVSVFKKWEKTLTLESVVPEFLTDALMAIFMHDNIYLLKPLNQYGELQEAPFQIKSVEQDLVEVFNSCYQQVNLKLLLQENFTDTACCNVAVVEGEGFRYSAYEDCDADHVYRLVITEPPADGDGLRLCDGDTLVPVSETDIIYNNDDLKYYRLHPVTGTMYEVLDRMPTITSVNESDPSKLVVSGIVLPYAFAIIEYNRDSHGWTDTMVTGSTDSSGTFTVDVPSSLIGGGTTFDLRIHMVNLDNDFGYSDPYIVLP